MVSYFKFLCALIGLIAVIDSSAGELKLSDKWDFAIDSQNQGCKE